MRIILVVFLCMAILGAFVVGDAVAGQICWNMQPFVDIVKLTVSIPDPLYPANRLVNGVWRDSAFLWPVVGSMVPSADGTQWIISIQGTRNDTTVWALRAVVDKTTKNGTWTIKNPETGFTNTGTFTKVPCSTPLPGVTELVESANSSTGAAH